MASVARVNGRRVLVVATGLALLDLLSQDAGDSFLPGGPLDEAAHLLTALLFLWALVRSGPPAFVAAVLATSVLIDADHIPGRLGIDWLSRGVPRPYTHSLLMIVVVACAAVIWRRRADALLGVTLGLIIHFGRDLTEAGGGVSLLWPVSRHAFKLPHAAYFVMMTLITLIALARDASPHDGGPSRYELAGYARLGSKIGVQETSEGERMHGADELSVGQLRRQRKLGTEAVYRVKDWSTELVRVEVVSGPGLQAGETHSLTQAAVLAMEIVEAPPGGPSPQAEKSPAQVLPSDTT